MYFKEFPYLEYEFPDKITRYFKDITIRPSIVSDVYGDSRNLQEYVVGEGQTPELVAYDVYGDAKLHWVIMIANDINNLYTDWPKTTNQFSDYLENKYAKQVDSDGNEVILSGTDLEEFIEFVGTPSNNYESKNSSNVRMRPHIFRDEDGNEYSQETVISPNKFDAFGRAYVLPEVTPISIFQYEEELNEAKRTLLVPKTSIAQRMRTELGSIVNE